MVADEDDFDRDHLYGIEKPQWKNCIESQTGLEYLSARYIVVQAARQLVNNDLSYVVNTDGLSDNLFDESNDISNYLADKDKPAADRLLLYMDDIVEEFSKRIYAYDLEQYGWEKNNVTDDLIQNIDNEEIKTKLQANIAEKRLHNFIDDKLHEIGWLDANKDTYSIEDIDDIIDDLKPEFEDSEFNKAGYIEEFDYWYDEYAEENIKPYLERKAFDVSEELEKENLWII
jgi:hypothetical protein